jgi:uncharacterized membrane protein
VVLSGAAIAYVVLERAIIAVNGPNSRLATAVGSDYKGRVSLALYLAGIICAFIQPWVSIALYVTVAMMWFVPDRRIEAAVRR